MRLNQRVCKQYENLFGKVGEEKFYRQILGNGFISRTSLEHHPEVLMLDHSEAFFSLYRRTGDERHFTIGKILRRAAHRLYGQFKRTIDGYPTNTRFLRIVK
jgi:hypothetical protein